MKLWKKNPPPHPECAHIAPRGDFIPTLGQLWTIGSAALRYRLFKTWGGEARKRQRILNFNMERFKIELEDVKNGNAFEIPLKQNGMVFIADACEQGDRSQMLMVPEIRQLAGEGQRLLFHGGDIYPVLSKKAAIKGFGKPYSCVPHKMHGFGNHDYYGRLVRAFEDRELHEILGGPPHLYYALVHERFRFIWLDSGATGDTMDQVQLAWYKNQLEKAKENAQFPIVAFHHPFYVNGEKKSHEFQRLTEAWAKQYGVKLSLQGHEHNFQHYHQGAIHYLMSGNGGGFITPTHVMEADASPLTIYPSAEQSKDKFSWNFSGRYYSRPFHARVPVPYFLRHIWAMEGHGDYYKGLVQMDVENDELVVRVRVRDNYGKPVYELIKPLRFALPKQEVV